MSTAPRVFVSHASEDKERFVIPFATALRENGVDAWVDQWEIRPGDRLVRKLFEEGLKNTSAFIAVISKFSIDKPWVKEELDKAIVDRIARETKIIPVVIDECEVPEALKATVWERVTDLKNFELSLNHVLDAIFDRRIRPPLGTPPIYFAEHAIDGLNSGDTVVLRSVYNAAVANNRYVIQPEHLFDQLNADGISKELFIESLHVLDHHHYVELKLVINGIFGNIGYIRPTHWGFSVYAEAFIPQYKEWYAKVLFRILNDGLKSNQQIAEAAAIPQFVVDQIFENLSRSNDIQLTSKSMSGHQQILRVSPMLRRRLVAR